MSSVRGFDAIAVAKPLTCLLGPRPVIVVHVYKSNILYKTIYIGLRYSVRFSGKQNTSHIETGFYVFYEVRSSQNGDIYFYFSPFPLAHALTQLIVTGKRFI